jgi:hypothetical protein
MYDESVSVDREVYAEMRSNVLLLAGEHYQKKDKDGTPFRDKSRQTSDRFQLRLVKNHLHKIVRHYGSSILSSAPGVAITPQIDSDLQDQKDADLNQAVWNQHKIDYRIKERIRQWTLDFSGVGELCSFMRWDPNAGELVGYGQKVDEKTGQPLFDEQGQPLGDEEAPIFAGKFVIKDLFPANVFRDANAKCMRDAPMIGFTEDVKKSELLLRYKGDEDKIKGIEYGAQEEFVVFDNARSAYGKSSKDRVLLKHFFFRKCADYPEGYFYIMAGQVVLEEGPLPFGIWPIIWAGFDELPTSPRGRSIIKVARPYIAEINRASSQLAMHQITIGDDKILYQKGSKLEQGALLPGVRGISFQGREPTVLPGRDGSQFLGYIQQQISELYSVVMLSELSEDTMSQMDPMALLYRAASHQKKFSLYIEKFEQYLIDFVTTLLEMSKHYLPDDAVIGAVGKGELINLEEFRKTSQLRYQIKVEPRADTLDQMLGRQMTFQNILQYVGKQLDKEDIGRVMAQMPYANKDAFSDFTLDEQNAKNDMLAMERGQYPQIGRGDDPAKMLRKLENRMRKPDFRFLDPQVQQLYEQRIQEYLKMQAQQQEKLLAEQADYIPMDGPSVKCDMYVNDQNDPTKPAQRAMFPQNALSWLKTRLEAQGSSFQMLEQLSPQMMAELSMMTNGQVQGGAMPAQPAAANGGSFPQAMPA